MSRFRPGQKVLVKQIKPSDGLPMRYVGKIVTILTNDSGDPDWPYRIVEDPRWVWREDHFTSCDEIGDPNIIFQMRKKK
jgi:hypothetical protein